MDIKEQKYSAHVPKGIQCVIGADIGGTNSNFGIFKKYNERPELLFSLHIKSKTISNFTEAVQEILCYINKNYEITIQDALFAAAGVVSPYKDFSKPTNLDFTIDAHELKQKTSLLCVYIVNDFEVIGYGINLIDPKNVVCINTGKAKPHANRAIIGAGTGLGKCTMFWSSYAGRYVPVASEGGHADAAFQTPSEFKLAEFIQKNEGFTCNISWEDVLSGNGIERIYRFFQKQSANFARNKKLEDLHPDEIFAKRDINGPSTSTFDLYTQLYARCAKNFTLDTLALGGLYIAGGIAAHNLPMFQTSLFKEEFINCGKQAHLLKETPIFVITDYNVSLYGAAYYLYLEGVCAL